MKNPSGTVVFMGAGASSAFGLPLTDKILPRIVERLRQDGQGVKQLFPGPDSARLNDDLRNAFLVLYPGLDLNLADDEGLPNITNVLSFLDHLILYDQPAGLRYGKEKLIHCRRLLERAIMEVLIDTDLSKIKEHLEDVQDYTPEILEIPDMLPRGMDDSQRKVLDLFVAWMFRKRDENGGPLSIITTNYDLAVETPIFQKMGLGSLETTVDFGFDWRNPFTDILVPRPQHPELGIYKLHGSLNWLRCDLCGQLYVNPREVIAYLSFNERQAWANTCACGEWPLRHLIVAPSMVRDVRDPHLLNVWRSATEALRIAREWYIIGYSLPAEDLAIRSMLLRAFSARGLEDGSRPLSERAGKAGPHLTVVQKGSSARPAYAAMFSKFDFIDGGLEQLVGLVA